MSETVISIENLSKKYIIGHQREASDGLRHRLEYAFRNPFGWLRKSPAGTPSRGTDKEEFWALKDVSFEIKKGEVVGIIGRNGAGKSTLLKILSRITEPTSGRIRFRGRVASLLEVGTGFHQELTGRENIFLNGAILGMSKADISRRFDEIVAFSEIEKFLDTPVKRYSSGMYVRLAFAVAAHLEPDILIVDEVLAVGDSQFQKKCLGKMDSVAKEKGRTVLFVSHNMATVNRLCGRSVLLVSGRVNADGESAAVTAKYLNSQEGGMAQRVYKDSTRPGDATVRLISARVVQNGVTCETIDIRYPVEIEITYENLKDDANLLSAVALFDAEGTFLFAPADFADPETARPRERGIYQSVCQVPGNLLSEGLIRVYVEVSTRAPVYQIHVRVQDCVAFQVVDSGEPGSVRAGWGRSIPGVVRPRCGWRTTRVQNHLELQQTPVGIEA